MNTDQKTWTAERIARMKGLVNAGLTCAQIAGEIGVSRNAVIGKLNRLGLSRSRSTADSPARQSGPRRRRNTGGTQGMLRALWASPQLAPAEALPDPSNRCSFMELQHWHCRWPCGDPSSNDFGFCGNKPVAGLPYCAAHARMAYRPSTRELSRMLRSVA